jgi:hypothetical protein
MHNTCEAFVGLVETHQALSRELLAVLAEKKLLKEEHHWSERYNVGSQCGAMVDSAARKRHVRRAARSAEPRQLPRGQSHERRFADRLGGR